MTRTRKRFRTKGTGEATVSISGGKERYALSSHNCSVLYYSKEGNQHYEKSILFNWERVYQKAVFLLSAQENAIKILLANGEKTIELQTLKSIDDEAIHRFVGVARFKRPISFPHDVSI